jgi:acyl carrier protein
MEHEIEQRLTPVFRRIFDDRVLVLRRELTAAEVPTWTSLTHVEMIAAVEATFSIRFKLKEIMKMRNVGDLIDAIEGHLSQPKPA